MLFKNMIVYRLAESMSALSVEQLETALVAKRATKIHATQREASGFVSPFADREDGPLVHSVENRMLVCLQTESKILPTTVIREATKKKIEEIEARDLRKVYRKERDQIRDEVLLNLLPRAFVKKTNLFALLCPRDGYVIVNTASHARAEEITAQIRDALGSFPIGPLYLKTPVRDVMTQFLSAKGDVPHLTGAGFYIGRSCELYNPLQRTSAVGCKDLDLDADEVTRHLEVGMQVRKLEIKWGDELECVVTPEFNFRQVHMGGVFEQESARLTEELDDIDAERDATLALAAGTYVKFIAAIVSAFGGEAGPMPGKAQPDGDSHLQVDAFAFAEEYADA